MKKILLLILLSLSITSCVTAPSYIKERAVLDLNKECADLLISPGYQESANNSSMGLTHAYFSVARFETTDNVAVCSYGTGGKLATTDLQVRSIALSGCEEMRLNYMSQNNILLKACEIYAKNNQILGIED